MPSRTSCWSWYALVVASQAAQRAGHGVLGGQFGEHVGVGRGPQPLQHGPVEFVCLPEPAAGLHQVALLRRQVEHRLGQRRKHLGPAVADPLGQGQAGGVLAAADAVAQAVEHRLLDAWPGAVERPRGFEVRQQFGVPRPVPAVEGLPGSASASRVRTAWRWGFAAVRADQLGDDVVDEPVHVHRLLVGPISTPTGPRVSAGEHGVVHQRVQGPRPGRQVRRHPPQLLGEVGVRVGADEPERNAAGRERGAQAEDVEGLRAAPGAAG